MSEPLGPFAYTPAELIRRILEEAAVSSGHDARRLSLVSSWVRAMALPHAWRTVALTSEAGVQSLLEHVVRRTRLKCERPGSPHPLALVRNLLIQYPRDDEVVGMSVLEIVEACTSVARLSLDFMAFAEGIFYMATNRDPTEDVFRGRPIDFNLVCPDPMTYPYGLEQTSFPSFTSTITRLTLSTHTNWIYFPWIFPNTERLALALDEGPATCDAAFMGKIFAVLGGPRKFPEIEQLVLIVNLEDLRRHPQALLLDGIRRDPRLCIVFTSGADLVAHWIADTSADQDLWDRAREDTHVWVAEQQEAQES